MSPMYAKHEPNTTGKSPHNPENILPKRRYSVRNSKWITIICSTIKISKPKQESRSGSLLPARSPHAPNKVVVSKDGRLSENATASDTGQPKKSYASLKLEVDEKLKEKQTFMIALYTVEA